MAERPQVLIPQDLHKSQQFWGISWECHGNNSNVGYRLVWGGPPPQQILDTE